MNGLKRVIQLTADGSATVAIPDLAITYHSRFGALQESEHIFLNAGLSEAFRTFGARNLNVLEMGFGTGLNAWLTALAAARAGRDILYTTLELYPLLPSETNALQYGTDEAELRLFRELHAADWEASCRLAPWFSIQKLQRSLLAYQPDQPFHLIYFDAFAPEDQPELWTADIFRKLYDGMTAGGLLVTYCSKSVVRKAMVAVGFGVEKLPGPKGKREILRARKPA